MNFQIISTLLVFAAISTVSSAYGICDLPLHLGVQNCSNQSSIRFHYDEHVKRCLAFKYSGCGGNENNFETNSECNSRCIPMDYFPCPGGSEPVNNTDGTTYCDTYQRKECNGPSSYCLAGAFVGKCCSVDARDKAAIDYGKTCGPNLNKYLFDFGGYKLPLFGKSCDSNFCPEKTTCQQGYFFAYCCSPAS